MEKFLLKKLISEIIQDKNQVLLPERPWSVEFNFKMKNGDAADSEGIGPDGLQFIFNSGKDELKIIVDSYWNPHTSDTSGNELKIFVNNELKEKTYVPVKFDDGKLQKLIVSNSPVEKKVSVLHSHIDDVPVYYLCVHNPFKISKPIKIKHSPLMNKGNIMCKIKNITNL